MSTTARGGRLKARYGPWAVVAGASEGLGAAFAAELAGRGFKLVLVARREGVLRELANELHRRTGAETRPIVGDLAHEETLRAVTEACAELDAGLLVYNAAHAPRGSFSETGAQELRGAVGVNVLAPVELVHRLVPLFERRTQGSRAGGGDGGDHGAGGAARPGGSDAGFAEDTDRRAGVILMSSLAGDQGSPGVATYAATKAFTTILGQGLWHELRPRSIDVTVCVAGAVRTPGLAAAREAGSGGGGAGGEAPGTLDPDVVARSALAGLGKKAVVVPGVVNRIARFVMRRLLPSRATIAIMASSTQSLRNAKKEHNND